MKQITISDMLPIIEEVLSSGGEFNMIPSGSSMLPTICGGEDLVALVSATDRLMRYDLVLYRRDEGTFVLHRVMGFSNGGYTMCGDAQYVLERGIKHSQIIGVVRWYENKGKKIVCHGIKFRLYGMMISFIRLGRVLKSIIKNKSD